MDEGHFVKVFDVLDSGFKDWPFSAFGLIFVGFGLLFFFAPRLVKATGIPFMDFKSRTASLYRYFFLGFAILWTGGAFLGTFTSYLRHRALVRDNKCIVVEGPVENFVPMPYTGHADETFSVAGVPFAYSDYGVTDAFNNTASHGGPINGNSYVRICYDPKGNAILRLEIKDFKGPIGNYGKTELFPDTGNQQKSNDRNEIGVQPVIPWYFNLVFILLLLDIVATQNLYLPYIGTFLRIRSAPVDNQPVPPTLAADVKTKLRNSTIYWDRAGQAIWLLPRGFNRLRLQLMVARLNVEHEAITREEICFSSGMPVIVALVLVTFYGLLSQTIPPDVRPSAEPIVSIFVVVMIVANFIRIRRDAARMEMLVRDALSELR